MNEYNSVYLPRNKPSPSAYSPSPSYPPNPIYPSSPSYPSSSNPSAIPNYPAPPPPSAHVPSTTPSYPPYNGIPSASPSYPASSASKPSYPVVPTASSYRPGTSPSYPPYSTGTPSYPATSATKPSYPASPTASGNNPNSQFSSTYKHGPAPSYPLNTNYGSSGYKPGASATPSYPPKSSPSVPSYPPPKPPSSSVTKPGSIYNPNSSATRPSSNVSKPSSNVSKPSSNVSKPSSGVSKPSSTVYNYSKNNNDNLNACLPLRNGIRNSVNQPCKFGERGSGLRPRGEPQDFQKIRAHCRRQNILFEDPEFPANDSSIFFSQTPPKPFEWKRPHELCEDPRLFVEGASRFDVQQGELGDCWLLAAVANLTLNQVLFVRVVPDDQSFTDDYAGIFHFRFWQYGRWVDVVVDDRLPTYYGRLVFMHSTERNEFWSALLEKAYAKLHGSYEALKGGTTCEAMEDFTGGVTELYELDKAPPGLFRILLKAYERSSLMGCSIEPDPNVVEAQLPNGLVRGHAYSITRIKNVDIKTQRVQGKIPLVRIRNPWGNEHEWVGAWSDRSPEWQYIPDGEKQELGLTFESDGEFWMSFQDFMKNFNRLEVCNLDPDSLDDDLRASGKKWDANMFEGSWLRGVTAGGCRNTLETFWSNPQYRIQLEDADDDDDDDDNDDDKGKCTVIVGLMQKNRRTMRRMGKECLTIGFAIYKLENPNILPTPLDLNFFKYNASVARSPSFINLREVCARFKLPPGAYCIVPSTFEPNEEGEFVLRVFSEKKSDMKENDEAVSLDRPDEDVKSRSPNKGPGRPNIRTASNRTLPDTDAKEAMRAVFQKLSGDDMEIDSYELKDVLDLALKREFQFGGFSVDVCRSMVAMMDVDRSGKLGFEEFLELWSDILTWKKIFKSFDKDNSQSLTTFELRTALHSAGYHLNWHVLRALVLRYGEKNSTLTFDNFILCAVRLKSMIESFKDKAGGTSEAKFTMEEWIEKTMYS